MSDDEGRPRPAILHRKSINKLEIVFDEKSRSDFITGFRKRRKERQEYAKQQIAKRHREEKSKLRKQRFDLLDRKVKQVEAVKDRAAKLYKEQVQSTTEYEADENVITATVAPLFGNDSSDQTTNNNNSKKRKPAWYEQEEEEEEEDEEDIEDLEGAGFRDATESLKDLHDKMKNVQPKTKPKRKPKRGEDGELLNKKKPRRGGGGKANRGKKRK